MSQTLEDIAKQLSTPQVTKKTVTTETKQIAPKEVEETKPVPKVQLIYAFNGTGKTRLSRAVKDLVAPKAEDDDGEDTAEMSRQKILYYNAFTEDLFYWHNDLQGDGDPKLKIQPNSFTDWILKDQGQEINVTKNFQRYANDKLTPMFNDEYKIKTKDELGQEKETVVEAFSEVTFSLERGTDDHLGNLKISKGEENNFIWSIFYTLLEEVVSVLNVAEPEDRTTDQFNQLKYVFIDDPVSSLDENHLIELAVNLAKLITDAPPELKFVVATHSPLFYNVLHSGLGTKKCYLLERLESGEFSLNEKSGNSNGSFSYHLHLKHILEQAIAENKVQKFHFALLRNLYEKTAGFLGYHPWSKLLPDDQKAYLKQIMHFSSHLTLSGEEVAEPTGPEKQTVGFLLKHLVEECNFHQIGEQQQ